MKKLIFSIESLVRLITLILFSLMVSGCSQNYQIPDLSDFNTYFEIHCLEKGSADTIYSPTDNHPLYFSYVVSGGDGSPQDPFVLEMSIKNTGPAKWDGVVKFSLKTQDTNTRFFMPAFLYGRNRGEVERKPDSRLFPRLREGEINPPYSNYWLVRADRLSHPVTAMFTEGKVLGISGSPYQIIRENERINWEPGMHNSVKVFNGFGCSVENGSSISYTLGYENAPKLYAAAHILLNRQPLTQDNCISIEADKGFSFKLYIYAYKAMDEIDVSEIIRNQYNLYHQSPQKGASYKQTVSDISYAIFRDSYLSEIKNYSTQVYLNKDGSFKYNPLASISWTGGAEIATPVLMASARLNNASMRMQAVECIQNIVDNSLNPESGLPFDAYKNGSWTTQGWWSAKLGNRKVHTSYVVGQSLYYILKAYEYEKIYYNTEHKDWLAFVRSVLDKISRTVNEHDEIPYLWSENNGEGIEYDAFSGAWCLAAYAYFDYLTEDDFYLPLSRRLAKHYYNKYVLKMECYGTPLDTYKAVDSEGILAYIKAVTYLHKLTGESQYLKKLKAAIDYEFSFKFCYNVPVQVDPLKKLKWSSSGGSVTSTSNQHIHPMSSNIADEIYYYYSVTNDSYYKSRLDDVIRWGMQSYNQYDNQFDFGKKGWMSERFSYSEAVLTETYPSGEPASTWFCFLPWGASNVIEGMCGDLWNLKEYNK